MRGPVAAIVKSSAGLAIVQLLVTMAIALAALGFPTRDLRVPLNNYGDSYQWLIIAKGTVDHGWWWSNPSLSAPFGFNAIAYPVNHNVDQALVWLVSRFSREPALCLNLAWLGMVAISGVMASAAIRLLGAARLWAFVFGTLFALLPYSIYRNTGMFPLSPWLVPLPCAAVLATASARLPEMRFGSLSLIAGCALLAVNYIYYAFFVAFSLIVAATLATRSGDRRFVRFGLVCLGVVCVVTAFNLAPTYLAWSREGEPVTMFHKVPAEAEIYGLKIRHLITPEPDHTFGPFRTMSELTAEAHFPLENENMTARLGLVASSGFLFLLGVIFHPQAVSALAHRDLIAAGARVTLACLLLATVGGFGSVFNLLIAPDVRTYNRVAPLIAFFSLAALAFLLDGVRWGKRVSGTLLAAAILALGVWDQTHAFARLARSAPAVASDFAALNVQVAQIESRLPENAAVYQLPFSYFLGDAGIVRMAPYESAALPFASTTLRWSFPAMSNESTFWGRRVSRLPVPEMLAALRAAGFSALCLNRLGYDDNAHTLESALTTLLGAESVILSDLRYLVFDIRSIPIPDDAALEPDRLSVDPRTVATSVGLPPCSTKQAVGFVDQLNSRRVLAGAHPVVRSGVDLTVRGWAVWDATKTEVGSVDVLVDGVPFGSYYGIERPDVAAGYNQSGYRLTGYVTTVPSDKVTEGGHTLVIRAVAPDRHCYDDVATTGFVVR